MDSLERTIRDIGSVKIQGARSIAISGLKALKEIVDKKGFGREFERAANLLQMSRPTAGALHNAITRINKSRDSADLDKMIYYFENASSVIASQNSNVVKSSSVILTHCHSTAVVELLKRAWENKVRFKVIATETRPLVQGRKTAEELSEAGIPVVYTDDMAPAHLLQMHKHKINMLMLGADSIRKEGVVNKVGSYMLAVFAAENRIPVYFVAELMKLDTRKKVFIEERNPEEIISPKSIRGVKIENPAFDITPWRYVTAVLTEKGPISPRKLQMMLK